MTDYKALIADCDQAICSGGAHRVAALLIGLNYSRVPREWALPLARICRRSGAWKAGLTLLSKIINSETFGPAASANECAEYGMLLYRFGATGEAADLLSAIDPSQAPEALHYLGLVNLSRWDLPMAIENINRYIRSSPKSYSELVAKANLALAHIENNDTELASLLLEEVISLSEKEHQFRILNAALTYRAQLSIHLGDFKSARSDLERAGRTLESAPSSDRFNFLKLRLILSAMENKNPSPLEELSSMARSGHAWGDVRIADLYSCRIKFEMSLFLKLLFGTPFVGFRNRLLREFQILTDRDFFYLGFKDAPRLHLSSGQILSGAYAPPGPKSLQFLEVILRDFYQPLRIPGVFSALFPLERFNVDSSADRTHQIINRTRRWLKSQNIPLEIFERDSFYFLNITGDFSFLLPLERKSVDVMSLHFEKLSHALGSSPSFSARQARDHLQVSRHTVQRILTWGLERNLIGKRIQGRAVHYSFIDEQRKAG